MDINNNNEKEKHIEMCLLSLLLNYSLFFIQLLKHTHLICLCYILKFFPEHTRAV